jgi:hypothetical protein
MATYAQLAAEPEWLAEYIPPTLRILCERLQAHYGLGWSHIGCKGDENHLRGYHRSRAWILNSRYCTNRTYSVSRTPGDRAGGDPNWLCAVDATLPRAELLAACKRLDAAVRGGRLEKVVEWYGNTDGDGRVDGFDNIANAIASSDSSHLWHLHMSFDRGRANEDHSDLFAIITGEDMPTAQEIAAALLDTKLGRTGPTAGVALQDGYVRTVAMQAEVTALRVVVEGIVSGDADVAAILAAMDERLAAFRAQIEADTRDAVADLAEGGAVAVRADS